ncbi:hypothetical protein V1514DRAFT_318049 [Lipomyces japonicus]|uniref:uncharacterized protein n=1 Tax=Lipomyces japonicus TaxID=56871 RepID=UPI0034CF7C88
MTLHRRIIDALDVKPIGMDELELSYIADLSEFINLAPLININSEVKEVKLEIPNSQNENNAALTVSKPSSLLVCGSRKVRFGMVGTIEFQRNQTTTMVGVDSFIENFKTGRYSLPSADLAANIKPILKNSNHVAENDHPSLPTISSISSQRSFVSKFGSLRKNNDNLAETTPISESNDDCKVSARMIYIDGTTRHGLHKSKFRKLFCRYKAHKVFFTKIPDLE